jgi:hypothetical protein
VHWTGYEWLIGIVLITGTIIALFLMSRKKMKEGLVVVFICSLLTVNAASLIIAPRIEQYSQGAAIEFYAYLQTKDCYVETIGFKSYAHLFYSHKQPQANKNSYNIEWLLKGPIDKPAYFASKITSLDEIKQKYSDLIELYRKNGFVFWLRRPKC